MIEARLQKALEVLPHGRTGFVVAHRLSTICNASHVLMLGIVERGTHDELVVLEGAYADLYRQFTQAED